MEKKQKRISANRIYVSEDPVKKAYLSLYLCIVRKYTVFQALKAMGMTYKIRRTKEEINDEDANT